MAKLNKSMFYDKDIKEVAKSLIGLTLNFPNADFPLKKGTITEVQWYDIEGNDPETTAEKQGDGLLIEPGKIFIFESMGPTVMLISAISDKTRACVRINAVTGIGVKANFVTRGVGITAFNRDKFQEKDILDNKNNLYLSESEIDIPEIEYFTPRRSKLEKGLRINIK